MNRKYNKHTAHNWISKIPTKLIIVCWDTEGFLSPLSAFFPLNSLNNKEAFLRFDLLSYNMILLSLRNKIWKQRFILGCHVSCDMTASGRFWLICREATSPYKNIYAKKKEASNTLQAHEQTKPFPQSKDRSRRYEIHCRSTLWTWDLMKSRSLLKSSAK